MHLLGENHISHLSPVHEKKQHRLLRAVHHEAKNVPCGEAWCNQPAMVIKVRAHHTMTTQHLTMRHLTMRHPPYAVIGPPKTVTEIHNIFRFSLASLFRFFPFSLILFSVAFTSYSLSEQRERERKRERALTWITYLRFKLPGWQRVTACNMGCDMRKKITRTFASFILFGVIGDFIRSVCCIQGIFCFA